MKKLLVFLGFVFILLYFLFPKEEKQEELVINEDRAIFISYIECSKYIKNKNGKEVIDEMIKTIKDNNFNMIILQVRPFADAIYPSKYFLSSHTVVEKEGDPLEFDILEYFIKVAHENNISLHAWINPYRIRSNSDINDISKDSYFYDWINTNKIKIDDGVYFNPSSEEVLKLILDGVKEIVENYDVDGILYDDYFYPSDDIDLDDYIKYQKDGGEMSLDEYHINIINNLIRKTYEAIKSIKPNVLFGISPAGNIENNLYQESLDMKYILSQKGYLDYVMPQLYYGFKNSNKPFIDTLNIWNSLITNDETKLYVALSFYKTGVVDTYAGNGSNEWVEDNDIIKKQIIISRNINNYQGFSLFRYEHLFNKDIYTKNNAKELENLINLFIS